MNDYIDQLIDEAKALNKDFLAGAKYSWYSYSPNHLGYARWKQNVLQVLRSFGEHNPYYKDLIAVEKEQSASRPRAVFSFFLETLKKAAQFPPEGLSWPHLPAPQPTPASELNRNELDTGSGIAERGESPVRTPQQTAKTTNKVQPYKCPEAVKEVSITEPALRRTGGNEKLKEEPPHKSFDQLDLEASEIYGLLLAEAREILIQSDSPYAQKRINIPDLCVLSLKTLKANPVLLTYATSTSTENYLYAHTINVTILCQAMALDQGLPLDDTLLLSFCAMAHDLGMTELEEIYSKKEYLNDSEFSRITRHVDAGIEKLDRITDMAPHLREKAKNILRQTHERDDSSGYPLRLPGKEIDLLAQIIGAADTYEAMTHPRRWREAYHPCEVVRQFIEGDRKLGLKVTRSLIRTLSIYPPSALVKLSTGEIARVVMPRKGLLSRPLVEVLLGPDSFPIRPYILDLSVQLVHHSIKRPVSKSELKNRNPEFFSQLESSGWWEKSSMYKHRSDIHI